MMAGARERRVVAMAVGLAFLLLAAGALLPLWSMTLYAPQYVNGLRLTIEGRGVRGDVDELNALNHYIGMPPIRQEDIPEARLFYPAVAAIAVGLLLVPFMPWRPFRWLVLFGAWALPLAFLADLQWRLHTFGHSLDPKAAFRLPLFTPKVLGPTVVMNFNVMAIPGAGLLLLLLSALVATFGPRLASRGLHWRRAGASMGLAATAALVLAPAAPASTLARVPVAGFDLRAAVAAAAPGAVLDVPPGLYDGPLVLTRAITLRGGGQAVIDGGGRGDVVVIAGDDVHLEGFVVRGSALVFSREAAGIVVRGARAVVRDNRIDDVLFGIYLAGARDAVLEGNVVRAADLPVERRGHAIYLWRAHRNHLRANHVLRGKDGIYISFSDDNTVEDNRIKGCRYGIHYMYANRNTFRRNTFEDNLVGAAVMYSTDVTLDGNIFAGSRSSAAGTGLIFKDADRLLVRSNRVVRNRIGMEFDNTPATIGSWARVERNLIAFNEIGFNLMSTAAITATENVIVENLQAVRWRGAATSGGNRWAAGGRGNYWGDYAGFDATGDGIGDVPYRRTDLLEGLAGRAPALQAFLFTPAHLALEAGVRLVPLVRAEPVVEDPAPLLRAPHVLTGSGPEKAATTGVDLFVTGLGMLVPGVAGLVGLRLWRRRP
ncbi:MAG: nitrous oxide reductase family maturation protein NosD [Armatimonadota bacterium]|nr:nitrous oxide reductase family maturation protein NosD [Armatimonadota bacterium]